MELSITLICSAQVSALESEVRDLQTEFEADREEYLETIRMQGQQLKLLQQITDKMQVSYRRSLNLPFLTLFILQPLVRRDCNYANIERIKRDARWDENAERWIVPDVQLNSNQRLPNQNGDG